MSMSTDFKRKLFINGKWEIAENYTPLLSPFNGEQIGQIPVATLEDADRAIAAACSAEKTMAKMPAHQRATILDKLVVLLENRSEEAARIIAKEAAKPIKTARDEVARTIQTYRFAAAAARNVHGESLGLDAAPGGENRVSYTVKESLGVIGAITPFNFPMNLVAHKVGPAIAAGNPIVLKPASQTPISSFFLAELLEEAGLPAGALNVITGSGRVIGDKIVTDDRVKMITFTGSPEVGMGIRNKAGLKKVTLELGSNSAVIIDQDVDIEPMIERCVRGAFAFQGQVCISLQRVYVHEDQYEMFMKRFVEVTRTLKLGDPLDEATDVSALISEGDVVRAKAWIQEAVNSGATVACGGENEGNILEPTVLVDVKSTMKVSCQEVFAPIVIIDRILSMEEGVERVNDSRFGLQAGVYTNNVNKAFDAIENLKVGGVIINDIPTFRVDHMPYGGVKESGSGREGIKYAIEEMTELKLVIFNRNK